MERTATAREGIWTIDAEGNTLFASDAMAAMLGTTTEDMIGKPSFEYVYPEDVEAAQRLFAAKSRGDLSRFEFRMRRKDGTPLWVAVQGTPMHDEAGRFRGIIGTFRAMRRSGNIKSKQQNADSRV